MRNPLVWLLLALLVGGAALLMWGGLTDSNEPLAANDLEAEAPERKRDPADLVRPDIEVPEPEVETRPADVPVAEVDETTPSEKREAIPSKAPIRINGRVVSLEDGTGVPEVWISLACGQRFEIWNSPNPFSELDDTRPPGALIQVQTDAEGRFAIDLAPEELESDCGVYAAISEGFHVVNSPQYLGPANVLTGAELLFEAKVWPPPVAGNISGWLRTENGSFPANAIPRTNHILLDIVSTELPAIERRANIEAVEQDDGVVFRFEFPDVPEGEYNLTLSSLGNYRWAPTSMLVVPPVEGLEFLRFDMDEALPLEFEVLDAESKDFVLGFEARHIKISDSDEQGVLLHTGPLEGEQFPLDQPFLWSVEADGYATAYGDESVFEMRDGKRVARIELVPGWSRRFLVMGGERGSRPRPLPGADVYLDGEFQGRTGPGGGLVVFLAEAPSEVEVRYLDWQPLSPISLEKRRSNVTPVVMAEPERD